MRKTVATALDASGLTAREIADQLGHANIAMTQRHYLGRRALGPAAAAALESFGEADEADADL
jgi:integrase